MRSQANRIRERAASRTWHHPGRVDSLIDETVEQVELFIHPHRVRFGVGPENGESDTVGQQPAAMMDEPVRIGRKIGRKRCDYRRKNAANLLFLGGHE